MIEFLLERFQQNPARDAIVWRDRAYSYAWLLERVTQAAQLLASAAVPRGAVVTIQADFSPSSVAVFLALVEHRCVLVPLTSSVATHHQEFTDIAQVEVNITVDADDQVTITPLGRSADHSLYGQLRASDHPGLVLFSSGSTGKSKAAVHDLAPLFEKFKVPRQTLRTISFLLYDHIGGVNTMLYILSNAGCMVTVSDRSPDTVLAVIAKYGVQLLPTSPTFLNLILLSQAWQRHDLRSLQLVTYGTEPMPESTLRRFHELFPHITLQQTYGLSEVGILRSKSRSSDSLWMKIGGEGFETQIVDGMLQIKARSAMLGYLNAPSPFTADGWFLTGDVMEVDGDYMRILGRRSEIINVGGEKVFPAEVESVLLQMPGVRDAAVLGERNPITGQIVVARINLAEREEPAAFRKRMRAFCRERLAAFKIPARVEIVESDQHSARFKKMRLATAETAHA